MIKLEPKLCASFTARISTKVDTVVGPLNISGFSVVATPHKPLTASLALCVSR